MYAKFVLLELRICWGHIGIKIKYSIHIKYPTSTGKFNIWFRFMVFNATFNNISVISWRSVLLVEETGVSGENHQPLESHWQTFII
jgi:hypothetical protein